MFKIMNFNHFYNTMMKTEESLTQLQMSIHPTTTEKMFSVLKPGLKTLNPQNDQRRNPEL
jgi:hypothetical protein